MSHTMKFTKIADGQFEATCSCGGWTRLFDKRRYMNHKVKTATENRVHMLIDARVEFDTHAYGDARTGNVIRAEARAYLASLPASQRRKAHSLVLWHNTRTGSITHWNVLPTTDDVRDMWREASVRVSSMEKVNKGRTAA